MNKWKSEHKCAVSSGLSVDCRIQIGWHISQHDYSSLCKKGGADVFIAAATFSVLVSGETTTNNILSLAVLIISTKLLLLFGLACLASGSQIFSLIESFLCRK